MSVKYRPDEFIECERLVWSVRIAHLAEDIHQRNGPLPSLWIGDDLSLEVLPVRSCSRTAYSGIRDW